MKIFFANFWPLQTLVNEWSIITFSITKLYNIREYMIKGPYLTSPSMSYLPKLDSFWTTNWVMNDHKTINARTCQKTAHMNRYLKDIFKLWQLLLFKLYEKN